MRNGSFEKITNMTAGARPLRWVGSYTPPPDLAYNMYLPHIVSITRAVFEHLRPLSQSLTKMSQANTFNYIYTGPSSAVGRVVMLYRRRHTTQPIKVLV